MTNPNHNPNPTHDPDSDLDQPREEPPLICAGCDTPFPPRVRQVFVARGIGLCCNDCAYGHAADAPAGDRPLVAVANISTLWSSPVGGSFQRHEIDSMIPLPALRSVPTDETGADDADTGGETDG